MIPVTYLKLAGAVVLALAAAALPGPIGRELPLLWQGELCTPDTDRAAFAAFMASLNPAAAGPQQSPMPAGPAPAAFDPAVTDARFELRPLSGKTAMAGADLAAVVTLVNRETSEPVTGLHMAGWMNLVRNGQVDAELPCAARVGLYAQGRVTHRADADLNASRLLTMSRSGAIALIDPQIDFTITQMQSVIQLPGIPADWALSRDQRTLFVSLPMASAIAVIDTSAFALATLVELDKGSLPTTLLPLPDGGLAVALSGAKAVSILHPANGQKGDPVAVGDGRVALADDGAGHVFALSEAGNLVSLNTSDGTLAAGAVLPPGEPSLAVTGWNRAVFAGTSDADAVSVFAARDLAPRGTVATGTGIHRLAAIPGGRGLLAIKRGESRLLMIDGERGLVTADIPTVREPVEIAFSDDYAYVRGLAADHFALLDRGTLIAGRLEPADIQSVSRPPVPREALASAGLITPYPGGAMIGNPDERQAYFYMEGMNAPMGTVRLYAPDVQGILTLDRGFREIGPGVYQSLTKLPKGGNYTVAMAIGDDGAPLCFDAAIAGAPGEAKIAAQPQLTVALDTVAPIPARVKSEVVLKLSGGAGSGRIRLVAFSSSGSWQARQWATALGDGRYAARWDFPRPGRYGINVELSGAGGRADPLYFKVVETGGMHSTKRTVP